MVVQISYAGCSNEVSTSTVSSTAWEQTKIKNLRWWIIGTCFLATAINYLDRQTLSIAASAICEEFGLTNSDYSSIVSSFLLAYTLGQGLFGRIIDAIDTRRGMAVSIVWWSIAGMLHAFGNGLWSFRIFRFLLGLGEAGNWPAATKVVAEWFPARERGLAVAIFDSGSSLGGILAPPVVAWIITSFGWRTAFVATGALGFCWLALWLWIYRKPEESSRITQSELDLILADRRETNSAPSKPAMRWASLLTYSEVWGLILGRLLTDCVWWFYVFWLPKYLAEARGFTLSEIAIVAWIPFLSVDVGNLGAGWLSGRLVQQKWSINAARKFVLACGAVGMVAGLPAGLTGNARLSLALIAVATLSYSLFATMMLTLPSDLFPSSVVASVSGLSGAGAGVGGIAFTWITGKVVDTTSYEPIFIAAGVMPLFALGLVCVLIPRINRIEPGMP